MIKLKFKLQLGGGNLYITPEYVSNGHWLLMRQNIRAAYQASQMLKSELKKIDKWQNGQYYNGEYVSAEVPDLAAVIPEDLSKYRPVTPIEIVFKPDSLILAGVKFQNNIHKITAVVAIEYAALYTLGNLCAVDGKSPLVVLSGDHILALVMPTRGT